YLADGKFDQLGHPFNARVAEAEKFCSGVGRARTRRFEAAAADGAGVMCAGALPGSQQLGELVLNLRVAAAHFAPGASLVTARVLAADRELASAPLEAASVRQSCARMNLPLRWANEPGRPASTHTS